MEACISRSICNLNSPFGWVFHDYACVHKEWLDFIHEDGLCPHNTKYCSKVTNNANIYLKDPVSTTNKKKLQRTCKANIYERATFAQSLITDTNVKMQKIQYHNNRTWTVGTKMSFNICPGETSHLTWILNTNQCGQFWRGEWEADSLHQHLYRNWQMFWHSTEDCSDVVQIHCKKVGSSIKGKWWSNAFIMKYCQCFPRAGIISSNRHQDSLSILSFLVVCNLSSTVKPIHLFSNFVLVKSCNASSREYIFLVFTVGSSRAQDVYASVCIWEYSAH